MPSPSWRTVPTSARSVSTSYSSIRWRRIDVISSGRSFMLLSAPCRCECRGEVVRAGRARSRRARIEPAWRTMPPIRSGSTLRVASTLRPDAFSICATMRPNSSSDSSCAVVSSTSRTPLLARRRAARTPRRSPRSRPRGPSRRRRGGSCVTSSSAPPSDVRRGRRAFTRDSISRVLEHGARAPATSSIAAARSASSLAHRRRACPASCAASKSARGVDAVRDGYERLASSCEKSISASASSISRCWSASVSVLPRDLLGRLERAGRRPRARICSSACAVACSICRARLLEAPLALLLGLLAHPLALRVGDPARLGEDLLGLGRAPGRSAPGAPRAALRASSRALSASSIDCRIRSRRSSISFWIGPNA